jgi:hypothetical protein
MEPEQAQLFSLQAEIIRLIQTAQGQSACYATPINGECGKPECVWRNDWAMKPASCFHPEGCAKRRRQNHPTFQPKLPGYSKPMTLRINLPPSAQTANARAGITLCAAHAKCRRRIAK